jgi:hypothetical protein
MSRSSCSMPWMMRAHPLKSLSFDSQIAFGRGVTSSAHACSHRLRSISEDRIGPGQRGLRGLCESVARVSASRLRGCLVILAQVIDRSGPPPAWEHSGSCLGGFLGVVWEGDRLRARLMTDISTGITRPGTQAVIGSDVRRVRPENVVAGSNDHSGRGRLNQPTVSLCGNLKVSKLTGTDGRTAIDRATQTSNRDTTFLAEPIRNRYVVTLTRFARRLPRKTHALATSCGMSTCRQVTP